MKISNLRIFVDVIHRVSVNVAGFFGGAGEDMRIMNELMTTTES